jgi:hypothetical protein
LGQELTQPQLFQAGKIRAVVRPRFLARADIFVLQMIKDGARPVFFSRTSGGYGAELGLGDYLLTQGLTRKLMTDSIGGGKDTVRVDGEGWVDVGRTVALSKEFKAPAALIKKNDWVDRPSVGIPYLYVATSFLLSEALAKQGDVAGSAAALAQAKAVAKATKLDRELFGQEPVAPVPASGDTAQKTQVPVGKKP